MPKTELLTQIAEALHVNRQNFYTDAPGSAEEIMREWLLRRQELHAGEISKSECFGSVDKVAP